MSRRRTEALRNLAERGATPGEREAAKRALEIHQDKQATSEPPRQGYAPYHWPHPSWFVSSEAERAAAAKAAREAFSHWSYDAPSFDPEKWKRQVHKAAEAAARAEQARRAAKPPPKDAFRPAVKADFPDAEDAMSGPERDTIRIVVKDSDTMYERFKTNKPFNVCWLGNIWRVNSLRGICRDQDHNRYFLTARTADMTQCFVRL